MAKNALNTKGIRTLQDLFVAHTNAGIWVRLLLLFFILNTIGVVLSLLFFFNVRNVGNRVIETTLEVPGTREVNKEEIHDILAAFSIRESVFLQRLESGVSIPDPY